MPRRIRDAEELRLGREPAKRTQKKREQPPTGVRRGVGGRAEKSVRLAEQRRELREQQQRIAVKERALAAVQAGSSSGQERAYRARPPAPPIGPSLRSVGRLAVGAEKALARKLLRDVTGDPASLAGPFGVMGSRTIQELAAGEEIAAAAHGEKFNPAWAGVEAAGVVPFLRPLRALRAARTAKAVEPVAPDPAGNLVREALGPARTARAEQQRGYKQARAERAGVAEEARVEAGGGLAGHRAAKAALKAELPKVKFDKLRQGVLSEGELDEMMRAVDRHPGLRFYEKVHTREALSKAFYEGRAPQTAQIRHLQAVFGQDAIKETSSKVAWKAAGNVINIPRSMMSTLDLSGTLRQGLVAAVAHPKLVARNMKPQVKALVSEKNHAAIMDEIYARPNADRYERSGLPLTTLDDIVTREEQFSSGLAETLTGGKRFSPVRASGRAYTGFLNKTRADLFDLLDDVARAEGVNVESVKFERDLARLVGSMTGRGPLPQSLQGAATFLNAIFFSPRLAASRIDLLLAPVTYLRADPFVRKQALKSMLRLYAVGGAILTLASAAGARVSLDPRNADFAKIRIGNSRIDVFGGFQQYARLIAQLYSNKIVSSTTGKTMTLGSGFGEMNRWDILERFAASKYAPPASFVRDFFKGTDFEGQPFDVKKATLQRLVPFIAQDLADTYRETGSIPATAGAAGLIGFGVGVQTYSTPTARERQAETDQKRYAEWETTAKQHFDGEIPAVLVRAKRNSMLVSDARRQLAEERGYEKLSELTEQDELRALISVFLGQNPDVDREPLMRLIQTASPVMALEASKRARKLLGINLLDKYAGLKGKAELAEREKAFAGK